MHSALILDYDNTLRRSLGQKDYPCRPDEVQLLPGRRERIIAYKTDFLLGVSNQSGIGKGELSLEDCVACFERTNELLGLKIDYLFCPHKPGDFCACRKPGKKLGLFLIEKYNLEPKLCLFVGDKETDKVFAERCGFNFTYAKDFFQ